MVHEIDIHGNKFTLRPNTRRKQISVGIDNINGELYIAYPASMTENGLARFLDKDIDSLLNKIRAKAPSIQKHIYAEGETFFFRGREYPLKHADIQPCKLNFDGHTFSILRSSLADAYTVFERWYSRALYYELKSLLPEWTKRISVRPVKVTVKTVSSLWGSCSSGGSLTFCTRLALVPPPLLEYVVVHELCHMKSMTHSKSFWDEVAKYVPDHRQRRDAFKKDGLIYRWW